MAYIKNGESILKAGNLLRHYDPLYRTTMRYIHIAKTLVRKDLLNEMYPE
jgi:hypothetical protein